MNETNENQWINLIEHDGIYVKLDIDYFITKSNDNRYQVTLIDYYHKNTYRIGSFDSIKQAEESINHYKQKLIDLANYEKHLEL